MRMIITGVVILVGVVVFASSGNELGTLGSVIAGIVGIALIFSGTRQFLNRRENPQD